MMGTFDLQLLRTKNKLEAHQKCEKIKTFVE